MLLPKKMIKLHLALSPVIGSDWRIIEGMQSDYGPRGMTGASGISGMSGFSGWSGVNPNVDRARVGVLDPVKRFADRQARTRAREYMQMREDLLDIWQLIRAQYHASLYNDVAPASYNQIFPVRNHDEGRQMMAQINMGNLSGLTLSPSSSLGAPTSMFDGNSLSHIFRRLREGVLFNTLFGTRD